MIHIKQNPYDAEMTGERELKGFGIVKDVTVCHLACIGE
jgi:hypothetical protein